MASQLLEGDCLEVMAEMETDSVDAVVTDPPYGLGFMGKCWDGMPPGPDTAEAMLRVLKPAHYLVAFGGTRTHHRLMCALEDAGFEIRDTLMWLYGSGFPKGKGQLKPAYEPIILCRKPGSKVRELGIDECRIATNDTLNGGAYSGGVRPTSAMGCTGEAGGKSSVFKAGTVRKTPDEFTQPSGRWPANIILDEASAAMLDEQSGVSKSTGGRASLGAFRNGDVYGKGRDEYEVRDPGLGDIGGASRFFYCAKASRSERNEGCEGLPLGPPPASARSNPAEGRQNPLGLPRHNHHPTVKPVDLMRWLVRLITPKGGTVLDPFMGSGTTGVACAKEGRGFIGIEREPEFLEIARQRIDAASRQGVLI